MYAPTHGKNLNLAFSHLAEGPFMFFYTQNMT